jgi:hypothetical protein
MTRRQARFRRARGWCGTEGPRRIWTRIAVCARTEQHETLVPSAIGFIKRGAEPAQNRINRVCHDTFIS